MFQCFFQSKGVEKQQCGGNFLFCLFCYDLRDHDRLIGGFDDDSLVEAFVEKITHILADQDEYLRLSLNAYRWALEKSTHNDDFCRDYVGLLCEPKHEPVNAWKKIG